MLKCTICGHTEFKRANVLWPLLIEQWEINAEEVDYINRQQGETCTHCGASLRVVALGKAVQKGLNDNRPLKEIASTREPARWFKKPAEPVRILDVNGAATISDVLSAMPGYIRGDYPDVDMMNMSFSDNSFDMILHSDTLEHVSDPVRALSECHRVLKPGGCVCFTIPMIVGRLTRSRDGLEPSYHGDPSSGADDWRVHTEFGADCWTYLIKAGFSDVRLFSVEYPAAHALMGVKEG